MTMIFDPTTGDASGIASINGGQLAGFRNRIINGNTTISQRGTAFTPTLGTIYTVDRWYLFTSGAVQASVQRQLGGGPSVQSPNFMTVIGSAGNTSTSFTQRIEAANSFDLSGQVVTVSAWIYTSDSRLVVPALNYANALDNFSSVTTIASTSTTAVSATGWRRVSSQFTAPNTQNGLEVGFAFGAVGAGVQVAFTGVQLELGPVATPFEQRPYGLELALCQRYLPSLQLASNSYACVGQCYSATAAQFMLKLPVTARVAPTGFVLSSGFLSTSNSVGYNAGGISSIASSTTDLGIINITGANGTLVAGNATSLISSANATLLFTGCEL